MDMYQKKKFMDELHDRVSNENESSHAVVNEVATVFRKTYDTDWVEFLNAWDYPTEINPPKHAKGFTTRVYNLDFMSVNENKFMDDFVPWLTESDHIIEQRMQPIYDAEENFSIAKANKVPKEELVNLKNRVTQLKEELQNELRSNEDLKIHVEYPYSFSAKEANQLKKILEPLNKLKKEFKSLKNRKQTEEVIIKKREIEKAIDDEQLRLQERAANKEISPLFYNRPPGAAFVVFKNPKDRLKFRDTFDTHEARVQQVSGDYRSIMNQTAEDTIAQMWHSYSTKPTPNPTMRRMIMYPDDKLWTGGYLNKNLGVNLANYRLFLGRRKFIKNIYKDVTIDGDISQLVEQVNKQFISMKNVLNEKKRNAKGEKEIKSIDNEILKLTKRFNRDIEDMSLNFKN